MRVPPDYVEYGIDHDGFITLPCFDIQILVDIEVGFGRVLHSDLTADVSNESSAYIAAMKAIENMILNHAFYGIDVCSEEYVIGIEAAVEDCEDLYG